jgi:hypothetical protein
MLRTALLMAISALLAGAAVTAQDPCLPTPAPPTGSIIATQLTTSSEVCWVAGLRDNRGNRYDGAPVDMQLTLTNTSSRDEHVWITITPNSYVGDAPVLWSADWSAASYRVSPTTVAVMISGAVVPAGTSRTFTWVVLFPTTGTVNDNPVAFQVFYTVGLSLGADPGGQDADLTAVGAPFAAWDLQTGVSLACPS